MGHPDDVEHSARPNVNDAVPTMNGDRLIAGTAGTV